MSWRVVVPRARAAISLANGGAPFADGAVVRAPRPFS